MVLFKFVKVNPLQATEWLLFMHFLSQKIRKETGKPVEQEFVAPSISVLRCIILLIALLSEDFQSSFKQFV